MTVHAAKGLEFDVVAVPDLGRNLNAGHSHGDITIGRPSDDGARRFGMRLAFPARRTVGLWELVDLNTAESEAEAEEGCRLVYVAASRARDRLILTGIYKPADLEPADERKPNDTPLRRLLPALAERGFAGEDAEVELPGAAADRRRRAGAADDPARDPDQRAGLQARRGARAQLPAAGGGRPVRLDRSGAAAARRGPGAGARRPPLLLGARALRAVRLSLLRRARARRSRGARARRRRGRRGAAGDPHRAARAGRRPRARARDRQRGARGARVERAARLAPGPTTSCSSACSRARGSRASRGARPRAPAGRRLAGLGPARRARRRRRGPRCRSSSASAGTVVRGKIDLLVDGGEVPTVVDYKTDALDGRAPAEAAARYAAQRQVYAPRRGRRDGRPRDPRLPRGARGAADRALRRATRCGRRARTSAS